MSDESSMKIGVELSRRATDAVIEHLRDLLGGGTMNALSFRLRQANTDMHNLLHEPEKVNAVLHNIFGSGADVVTNEMLKAAYGSFGLVPDATSGNLKTDLERLWYVLSSKYSGNSLQ